jgi:hypothetical protein
VRHQLTNHYRKNLFSAITMKEGLSGVVTAGGIQTTIIPVAGTANRNNTFSRAKKYLRPFFTAFGLRDNF